jgi:hypothetical protein
MEKEELHPNQVKLDKNKNGKLDAHDFKKLRGESKCDEDDDMEEGYVSHAQRKAVWASKNEKGVKEEVEELEENASLASELANKATKLTSNLKNNSANDKDLHFKAHLAHSKAANLRAKELKSNPDGHDAEDHEHMNNYHKKLAQKHYNLSEDFEQLDELSKNTLQNYIAGASTDMARSGNTLGRLQTHGKLPDVEKRISKNLSKRYHGINKAAEKLTKEQVEEIEALAAKHGLGE